MNEKMTTFMMEDKPIYIYGSSGSGKTYFIKKYFETKQELYFIYLSIKEIPNIQYIENISKRPVMDYFNKIKRDIIIVIDDIDVLSIQEKKIITDLIKMIKNYKKTKSKMEYKLIFIGINYNDKKIKELLSLSNSIPFENKHIFYNKNIYIHIENIIQKKENMINTDVLDSEKATQSLLLHENIINNITNENINFYFSFLKNFCNGDYYDRISFQKQLWIYNDITYFLKFINNYLLYNKENINIKTKNIRFTKVLTKYSNEYNNNVFIINLCNKLSLTNKELYNLCIENKIEELTIPEKNRLYKIYNIN